MALAARAQDITGMWHVKGVATVAEANPAEVTTTDWNGTMAIANLGGGEYRLTFSGDESATLEVSFAQAGDFFGYGDEVSDEEDARLLIHQRTGIYFVNATTLLFEHAEATMVPSEGSAGTLFSFESHRAVLTRVPLPDATPSGWTGAYSSVRGISLGVGNGAGFDADYLADVEDFVGTATAGGYRFFGEENAGNSQFNGTLFAAAGDRGLFRRATSSGGVLYEDDEWQIDRLLERSEGRAIQMGNGDLVYFGGGGQVGKFGSKNPNSGFEPTNVLNRAESEVIYLRREGDVVTLLTSPQSRVVAAGGSTTFSVTVSEVAGTTPTFQWYFNNRPISGATSRELTLAEVQPADAGAYHLGLTVGGWVSYSEPATLGLSSTEKAAGGAYEFDDDIVHPNGNSYDQVLLTGTAATVTADAGQVTRTSFIDLNDDIVQVEFSGAGTLAISLVSDALPAGPLKYNQSVDYMKGHATITITGADETSNVSIFTVGRMTAFDPTGGYDMTKPISDLNKPANNGSPLFKAGESYDGVADVALINISSETGRFGGVRAANARFYAVAGYTGVFAPGVRFSGPVYAHDVNARDDATPVLVTGAIDQTGEIRITGGNLEQANTRAVRIVGAAQVVMAAGITSHAVELPAQANAGRIERDEVDVTNAVVVTQN